MHIPLATIILLSVFAAVSSAADDIGPWHAGRQLLPAQGSMGWPDDMYMSGQQYLPNCNGVSAGPFVFWRDFTVFVVCVVGDQEHSQNTTVYKIHPSLQQPPERRVLPFTQQFPRDQFDYQVTMFQRSLMPNTTAASALHQTRHLSDPLFRIVFSPQVPVREHPPEPVRLYDWSSDAVIALPSRTASSAPQGWQISDSGIAYSDPFVDVEVRITEFEKSEASERRGAAEYVVNLMTKVELWPLLTDAVSPLWTHTETYQCGPGIGACDLGPDSGLSYNVVLLPNCTGSNHLIPVVIVPLNSRDIVAIDVRTSTPGSQRVLWRWQPSLTSWLDHIVSAPTLSSADAKVHDDYSVTLAKDDTVNRGIPLRLYVVPDSNHVLVMELPDLGPPVLVKRVYLSGVYVFGCALSISRSLSATQLTSSDGRSLMYNGALVIDPYETSLVHSVLSDGTIGEARPAKPPMSGLNFGRDDLCWRQCPASVSANVYCDPSDSNDCWHMSLYEFVSGSMVSVLAQRPTDSRYWDYSVDSMALVTVPVDVDNPTGSETEWRVFTFVTSSVPASYNGVYVMLSVGISSNNSGWHVARALAISSSVIGGVLALALIMARVARNPNVHQAIQSLQFVASAALLLVSLVLVLPQQHEAVHNIESFVSTFNDLDALKRTLMYSPRAASPQFRNESLCFCNFENAANAEPRGSQCTTSNCGSAVPGAGVTCSSVLSDNGLCDDSFFGWSCQCDSSHRVSGCTVDWSPNPHFVGQYSARVRNISSACLEHYDDIVFCLRALIVLHIVCSVLYLVLGTAGIVASGIHSGKGICSACHKHVPISKDSSGRGAWKHLRIFVKVVSASVNAVGMILALVWIVRVANLRTGGVVCTSPTGFLQQVVPGCAIRSNTFISEERLLLQAIDKCLALFLAKPIVHGSVLLSRFVATVMACCGHRMAYDAHGAQSYHLLLN